MVYKPMRRRAVIKALKKAGCAELRDTGPHTVWGCPCGNHEAPVPRHGDIAAGTVKSIGDQIACLGKGWLQ